MATTGLHPQTARADEVLPDVCAQAKIFIEANRLELADSYAEQCYQQAGASREVIIYGHYLRAVAQAGLNKPKEALEQLEILMQPQYTQSPIYDRRSFGLKHLGGTQASVHAEAARFSLVLGDADKGLRYAEKALTLAALEPATHIDVAGSAYMLRARIRASRQDNLGGARDLARAYVRGSQDPFVLENMKTFPEVDQKTLEALKTRMMSAYSKYLSIYMLTGSVVSSLTYLNELKAEGDTLYQAVLADERAYLGPET
ncbi:hypothetical protein ABAC402_17165 [Asticcacaulis sp. AC402]|nr:hypothetical protein ABAC402_17165 [Asticcacaulis sp. AC402]